MTPVDTNEIKSLITKITSKAAVSNHNILSDEELRRGKSILVIARQRIMDINQQMTALHAEWLKLRSVKIKLGAAMAPLKRIPAELLLEIFFACVDNKEESSTTSGDQWWMAPPRLNEIPWVLGHVCSLWRHLSRGDSRLWNIHPIVIRNNDPQHINHLPYAFNLIPSVVNFRVYFDGPDIASAVVPYLWRIHTLDVTLDIPGYSELCNSAFPGAFSCLQSTILRIKAGVGVSALASFKHAPRRSVVDALGFTGDLSMSLQAPREITGALLMLNFPWAQLTCLDLTQLRELELSVVFRILRKCPSLKNFIVHFDKRKSCLLPDGPQVMPHLEDLVVGQSVPMPFIHAEHYWDNLVSLNLLAVPSTNFTVFALIRILKLCVLLEKLYTPVPPNNNRSGSGHVILLPRLEIAFLSGLTHPWIFHCMVVPALIALNVEVPSNFSLDMAAVQQMILSSKCSLNHFGIGVCANNAASGIDFGWTLHTLYESRLKGFYNFLAAVPTIQEFKTLHDMLLEDKILDGISAGYILPQMSIMGCYNTLPECVLELVNVVHQRLEVESRNGRVVLQTLILTTHGFKEDIRNTVCSKLNALKQDYGIDYKLI